MLFSKESKFSRKLHSERQSLSIEEIKKDARRRKRNRNKK